MWFMLNLQQLLFLLLFGQSYVRCGQATWSSLNFSKVQLLGLFEEAFRTSEPNTLSVQSRAMFKAAVLLSHQYNITVGGQFIGWQTAQTDGNIMRALRSACLTVSIANIVGIVGPVLSREANTIADFGRTTGIPVISYTATDPNLSNRTVYPAFYRTVPSDNAAAVAIAQLFLRFNWTSCIIIYQNDAFGSSGAIAIKAAFLSNNLVVTQTVLFDIVTRQIRGDLKTDLINSPSRVIVLWAESIFASLILQSALESDVLGPKFTWISSSSVSLDSFNQSIHDKLIGILTMEPVAGSVANEPVNKTLVHAAYQIWQQHEPESFPGETEVDNYALFAFDATWSLIQSIEQLCSVTNDQSPPCLSIENSSFCFDRYLLNSSSFLSTIINTSFLGVSGRVKYSVDVTDRTADAYYIVRNIQPSSNGLDYVPVLVWPDSNAWKVYRRTSMIVWPGSSLKLPSDRALLSGVNLRIAVSISSPFTMSTNVTDPSGNSTWKLVGYIPDLIDLLKDRLGFTYNLVLLPSNTTYDMVTAQVEDGLYDILAGDVTITSQQREIIDFSSTIFDNALSIVVRKQSGVSVNILSYLKPFTYELWLMFLASSAFAAILIFFFEREENEALKNKSILSSGAMSSWYSLATLMGYGADFNVTTAAGRLLTLGLYIVTLVLVATYTAGLASDLILLKSQGIILGIDDIKSGKIPFNRIGICIDTAAEDFYLRQVSSGSRNFYPVKSRQDLYDSLLNGTTDAIFTDSGVAEYTTSSLYCNLTTVGEDFDPSDFGIVVSKGWIYKQELDTTILSLRERGTLDDLRRKWFHTGNCPDSSDLSSTAMGIETMGSLFVIFGVFSFLSIFLHAWRKRCYIKNCLLKWFRRAASLIQKNVSSR